MRKIVNERNMISDTKKIFHSFTKDNVHYRRGLGLIIVKRQMENALKKPFRSYGKLERLGSVMISVDCRVTPDSAKRFLLRKIDLIKTGELCSSPQALDYVERCFAEENNPSRFRKHVWTKSTKDDYD